jgi:hypothetical protein
MGRYAHIVHTLGTIHAVGVHLMCRCAGCMQNMGSCAHIVCILCAYCAHTSKTCVHIVHILCDKWHDWGESHEFGSQVVGPTVAWSLVSVGVNERGWWWQCGRAEKVWGRDTGQPLPATPWVDPSKWAQERPNQWGNDWDMLKKVLLDCFDDIWVNSWQFLGSFECAQVVGSLPMPDPLTHAGYLNLYYTLCIMHIICIKSFKCTQYLHKRCILSAQL